MRSVAVVGMHRSGTSVVSSMVASLGVEFGEQLAGPSRDNPYGYYEDRELMRLGDAVLEAAGGSWLKPPPRERIDAVMPDHLDAYRGVIDRLAARGIDFGLKDPRITLFFDHLLPLLPDPRIVVCIRESSKVVDSLLRRGLDPDDCRAATARYQADADKIVADQSGRLPLASMRYEEVTADPAAAVRTLAETLGRDVDEATVERTAALFKPSDEIAKVRGQMLVKEVFTTRNGMSRLVRRGIKRVVRRVRGVMRSSTAGRPGEAG